MAYAPELRTHSQKVCSLYKRAMRTLEAYHVARYVTRYHQVLLRNEFDKNKCIKDPKEQRRLLWLGQHEAFMKQHPLMPAKFAKSHGLCAGVAAERVVEPLDWVLDYWHPLEKAHYPCYFRCREQRKYTTPEDKKNGDVASKFLFSKTRAKHGKWGRGGKSGGSPRL